MSKLKDHREIGRELDLFSFHEVAPGAVFWHHKGYLIYRILVDSLRKLLKDHDYQEIFTPVMIRNDLMQKSGHLDFYNENIFKLDTYTDKEKKEAQRKVEKKIKDDLGKDYLTNYKDRPDEKIRIYDETMVIPEKRQVLVRIYLQKYNDDPKDNRLTYVLEFRPEYSFKPMNCPEACLVFSTKARSYRDLPIRYSEFGILHRNELSGVLGGAFRVRQFSIDDVHHFVRPDQIQREIKEVLLMVVDYYNKFGFKPQFYLSTKPDKAMGDPKLWEKAESDLKDALNSSKVKYRVKEKDGAFYGPKIDIHIKDSQDRDWQLATIQLDFQIPEKMKLEYTDSDGKKQRPVIVHQAILGSVERFIGIITEHFQGAFPLWISPVQVAVLSVSDKHKGEAKKVHEELIQSGIRSELNIENKMLGAKIRETTLQKVPYMVIMGDKEAAVKPLNVSVRTREGKDLGMQDLSKFVQLVKSNIEKFQ